MTAHPLRPGSLTGMDGLNGLNDPVAAAGPRPAAPSPVAPAANSATADAADGSFSLRWLASGDWPLVRRTLLAGYPGSDPLWWDAGFARLRAVPPAAAATPLAVLLQRGTQPVGVALMLPRPAWLDQHQGQRRINASSWAILPEARQRALWMARHTMDDPGTVYTALTPIASARRMLQRIGFRPTSHQCIVVPTPLLRHGPGAQAQVLGGQAALQALRDHPLQPALDDHLRLGCLLQALQTERGWQPLVWKRQRRLRVLPGVELLYAPSQDLVARHVGALARHLLGQGVLMMAFEAHEDLVPDFRCTRLFQQRLARGACDVQAVDHLYSEMVYLHR